MNLTKPQRRDLEILARQPHQWHMEGRVSARVCNNLVADYLVDRAVGLDADGEWVRMYRITEAGLALLEEL